MFSPLSPLTSFAHWPLMWFYSLAAVILIICLFNLFNICLCLELPVYCIIFSLHLSSSRPLSLSLFFCLSPSFSIPFLPRLCPLHAPSFLQDLWLIRPAVPSFFHWAPICGLLTKKSCGTIELPVVTEASLTAQASRECSLWPANPSTQRDPSPLPHLPRGSVVNSEFFPIPDDVPP